MGAATEQRVPPDSHIVYLGLGSNLGDRRQHLQRAVELLGREMTVEQVSSLYDTAPMLVTDQPRFLNMVCRARTTLAPEAALRTIKSIEQQVGRVPSVRYGPRSIDIDLLFYDALVLNTPTLTIPHPRIAERAFVLLPLAEIAPTLQHPVHGRTIASLAEDVAGADVQAMGHLIHNTG